MFTKQYTLTQQDKKVKLISIASNQSNPYSEKRLYEI